MRTNAVITDTVQWAGLVEGAEYKLKGILYEMGDGHVKMTEIATVEHPFTAKATTGSDDVVFNFDALYHCKSCLQAYNAPLHAHHQA